MNEYVEKCETKEWLEQIKAWKEEHPLTMKDRGRMSPMDIIQEMNRQFDDAIITTDVGQHQMFVTQYAEITEKKQLVTSGGLGTMDTASRRRSARRSEIRQDGHSLFPETAACR